MKKLLLAASLILVVCLLVACGGEAKDPQTQGNSGSGANAKVTDAYEMWFNFTIRQELAGQDAVVANWYFAVDVAWDGLSFEGASVFTREVQHHSGRYDVQEDVVISGRLSADEKNVETLTFRNERTGQIYEMLEFEFVGIPLNSDNPYSDSSFEFYLREGVEELGDYIMVWNEQSMRNGDIRNITDKFDFMANYDQEAEITISFYYN